MDYQDFVDGDKILLIAPAGYGKTYTIAESLKYTSGRQLILTHTHAGIASLKDKIKKTGIATNRYHVETISSFAQKYVKAFYIGTDVPVQEKSKYYHPFIIEKSTAIFRAKLVIAVIKETYSGLYVDEYQDCNKLQHEMILALSKSLKTHLLGDPLQGIFNFSGDLIDFHSDLLDFNRLPDLSVPYRWYQDGNNRQLGDWLKKLREKLELNEIIDLSSENVEGLHFLKINPDDFLNPQSNYRKYLKKLILNPDNNPDFDSLLLVVPEYVDDRGVPKGGVSDRAKMRAQIDYSRSLTLLEAIDDRSFYALAKKMDNLTTSIGRSQKPIVKIRKDILDKLFNKTQLGEWFNENGLKNKRLSVDKLVSEKLKGIIDEFISSPSSENIHSIILEVKNGLKAKYARDELLYTVLNTLKDSCIEEISIYEAMKNRRNIVRRSGRKVLGKCMGTTLLTKGLEFDTVAILNADNFNCPKNLYVALTRCCKNLIIFSSSSTLSPYS